MPRKKEDVAITWQTTRPHLSQMYNEGLEYSFASKDFKQINPFMYCKDFLQDAITAFLHKKRIVVYQFIYDPSSDIPLFMDRTRLLIANSQDSRLGEKIENCLDFLNQIETKLKMKKTTAVKCASPPELYKDCGVWLFEGSKRWMLAPPMISLYSLIIRLGFSHKKGVPFDETIKLIVSGSVKLYQRSDKDFIEKSQKALEWLFLYGERRLFYNKIAMNYPNNVSMNEIHNSFGIVSYSNRSTIIKKTCPHWYRLQGEQVNV